MTAQVCPNGAKRTKHHKQRPMQRTNSIQLLDTNQRHCLFDNAATTNQAIFSAIFNSLLEGGSTAFLQACKALQLVQRMNASSTYFPR